jgi:hypothetical protein
MNILRDCFPQSSLQLTSHFILSQSISLSNLLCFRFTLSCTSSTSLPLTHSQNTFAVRTYSFQRLSCSLGLIISITHFSFHVFLPNVLKKTEHRISSRCIWALITAFYLANKSLLIFEKKTFRRIICS